MISKKWSSQGGFSYLELVLVTLILMLCTGLISDTLSLGIRLFKNQTQHSQAVMLLDTLSAVIENDLWYTTGYNPGDGTFISAQNHNLPAQYGIGIWDAEKAVQDIGDTDSGMIWQSCQKAAEHGQIIRRMEYNGQYLYTPLTNPRDYVGHNSGATASDESKNGFYAALDIEASPNSGTIKQFTVAIQVFDSKDDNANLLESVRFSVYPIVEVNRVSEEAD